MGKLADIREYIEKNTTDRCKVYIGTDSKRYRKDGVWHAKFATAVVIHKEGKHGCKVFVIESTERDYDAKAGRPINRMMAEVYKTSEVYTYLEPFLINREVEIHLDINPSESHGSHCAMQQAVGYIKGVCNMNAFVKPFALAASFAADHHL